MAKRRRPYEHQADCHAVKRVRRYDTDHLSPLSDELLLRIFSNLPVSGLVLCQRVSNRFHSICGDSQLWKSAYYNRFVRPRASRIPGIRYSTTSPEVLLFSSRRSKWLGDDRLVKRGKEVDWKRQYRLRHNWSKGSCDRSHIQLTEPPSVAPLLVQLRDDIAYTVDTTTGLRAWHTKAGQKLLATVGLKGQGDRIGKTSAPTSLAVDVSKECSSNDCDVSVGFEDGHFSIYRLDRSRGCFSHKYSHPRSCNGMLAALAFSSPYILTLTEAQLLSVYTFTSISEVTPPDAVFTPPRLLSSLKSHTVWPPLSLSIRSTSADVIASIAFAIPTYLSGWSVGLQELQLTTQGEVVVSRLTSAVNQGFTPLSPSLSQVSSPSISQMSARSEGNGSGSFPSTAKPTSLSYAHPYLLASHPDNTLTLYLVSSTSAELSISQGTRLWGHTSSVSGVSVGGRGKAVSVSLRGEELRVWELEGGFASATSKRRLDAGDISVQVRPEKKSESDDGQHSKDRSTPETGIGLTLERSIKELNFSPGWIGFDDEQVIVLREEDQGRQTLAVYDFT
ncbi:MAG: hypothetical protein M1837_007428 [Sclerophora amabilis]|nr:MAG: hypothetical protein M1837_007428 [Sclerophora amabilis]